MKAVVLLMIVALVATAQTPIPHSLGECGFDNIFHGGSFEKADVLEPAEFRVPQGDLCEEYTFDRGWEKTVELRLGEGADEYLEWIELAVKVWNDTVSLSNGDPVIEISYEEPEYFRPTNTLWSAARRGVAPRGVGDGESAIYFKPSESSNAYRGITWVRWSGTRMVEADVYINTWAEEEYSRNLYKTKLIVDYDDDWGAYGYVNATFEVILHELGHALGLKHVPVTGNVMSYRLMEGLDEQWRPAVSTTVINRSSLDSENDPLDEPYLLPFAALKEYTYPNTYSEDEDWRRSEIMLFSEAVQLGEMEKMLLACIYEF